MPEMTIWDGRNYRGVSREKAVELQQAGKAQIFIGQSWQPFGRQLMGTEFPFKVEKIGKAMSPSGEDDASTYQTKDMVAKPRSRGRPRKKRTETDTAE